MFREAAEARSLANGWCQNNSRNLMNQKRRYAKEEFARRGDGELLIRD